MIECFDGVFAEKKEECQLTGVGFLIVILLVASFSYELPLINLSSYDRLNPRLFDISAFLFIGYWLFVGRNRGWRIRLRQPILWPWFWVMFFFGIATFVSFLWIPLDKYYFSLFYFAKYIEAFVVLSIFASIPFSEKDKKILLWVALIGGVWVSFYAILQYIGLFSIKRYLPTGQEIIQFDRGIYSTLGVTYFHLGMFAVLSWLIGLSVYSVSKGFVKFVALLCTLISFVPSLISGSKAGLIGSVLAIILLAFQGQYRAKFSTYILAGIIVVIGLLMLDHSVARQRLDEGSGGTPTQRILMGFRSISDIYDYHGPRLLAFGGGFYVVPSAPLKWKAEPHYRIGYGNHNIFLFPLEQAGLGAFIAALWLWFAISRALRTVRTVEDSSEININFSSSMHVFFIVMMCVGIAGQIFYLGFGTEHFTIYQLILYLLATTSVRFSKKQTIQ